MSAQGEVGVEMARHSQKPTRRLMICKPCKDGSCGSCVDILRSVYTDKMICQCDRRGHDGEPINNQILDPETGTVYAPGLEVSANGEVKFNA